VMELPCEIYTAKMPPRVKGVSLGAHPSCL
jgi:hypothetical protein